MFRSIRWRIALPYVVLILVTMAGLAIYLNDFLRRSYEQDLREKLTAESTLIGDHLGQLLAAGQAGEDMDALARHWSEVLEARVTIIAADGQVLGESHDDRSQMDNHLYRPEIQQALNQGQGSSIRFSQTVGYQMMYTAAPVRVNGNLAGFARVALPLQLVEANLDHLQRTLLTTTLLATLLAVLLALLIAERISSPIRELTTASQNLAEGRLSQTLLPATGDEVGQLSRVFNQMAVQLNHQIQSLIAERGKLSAVLENMTDGLVIVDPEGKVQLLNPAAGRMFGIRQEAALGRSLAEVLRHHQLVELWRLSQESGETEMTYLELGFRRISLLGIASPMEGDLPNNTLLLFQDLTRIRKLETVRQDFISNISHELRTPLASLKALTETLVEGALEDETAARRFLRQMEAELDALAQMVSELLQLSRIESGQVPLSLLPTLPLTILGSANERLHLQAERAGLRIEVACPENLPNVMADPVRLEQVIVNLLHNAIKFTPSGGIITLGAQLEGERVVFSVKDTGVGISPQDLPRIFERFYKADRARSGGGTGLGLAIVRHTVEAHGGETWAESVENQGSVFYFSIPTQTD